MEDIKKDKRTLSVYLDLQAENDINQASKLQKDLEMPCPTDLFD